MNYILYLHIVSASVWIGGSFFMLMLAISVKNKQNKDDIFLIMGKIYGYLGSIAFIILLISGYILIKEHHIIDMLLTKSSNKFIYLLQIKLFFVAIVFALTVIHTVISLVAINKTKTYIQNILSRLSSIGIFLLNLVILYYAMQLRDLF